MTRFVGVLALLALSSSALAVPLNFQHQGRLLDSTGTPLDGANDLTLRLYDAASGGTAVWEETHTGTNFDGGYYAVSIGSQSALDAEAFDGAALYLSIQVGTDAELPDRLALVSVPYAITAGTADIAHDVSSSASLDIAELAIGGTTVIGSDGQIAGSALGAASDTLAELGCSAGEQVVFDGSAWGCAAATHVADDIVSGTLSLDRIPTGTGGTEVALGNHTHTAAEVGALPDTTTAADIGGLSAAGGSLSGDLSIAGVVQVSDSASDTCDSDAAGAIRWTGDAFEGCTGEDWVVLASKATGGSAQTAGVTCATILASSPSASDGVYWIDPLGNKPFEAYCDMSTDGGGWTLVLHSYFSGSLPLSSDLQVDTPTRRSVHIGDVGAYAGITTNALYFMAMDPFKAVADESSELRFESDNQKTHSVLADFTMTDTYALDGSNESQVRTQMCGNNGNCFLDAKGLSTINNDQDNWPNACWNNNYHQQAWWYDDCFSYNPFWSSGRQHFSGYSSKDPATNHWAWWLR